MNIKQFFVLINLIVFTHLSAYCQKFPHIEFTSFRDTLAPLDMLFVQLEWGNQTAKNNYYPYPDRRKVIQVKRLNPDLTEWRNRTMSISEIGYGGASHDDEMQFIPPGYNSRTYYKIGPELYPDEMLTIKETVLAGFQPGTYQCRFIYLHQGYQTKHIDKCPECMVIQFNFVVLDSPPADEVALYDFLIKNDLANYVHNHRYIPENVLLFEEALQLAPETSSLKPFIHQAIANILHTHIYNLPKPRKPEDLAPYYERIVYHLQEAAKSKHPYLIQTMEGDITQFKFELEGIKAQMRRK
ncbi:MAG: hypothetical protein KF852_03695 [Saprospiraceae bacterium]|nr:hypothetical protein [Saprospiraceae bacterium]